MILFSLIVAAISASFLLLSFVIPRTPETREFVVGLRGYSIGVLLGSIILILLLT